jgi:glutathione peroxidase
MVMDARESDARRGRAALGAKGLYGMHLQADTIDGATLDLDVYRGRVLLVVNVASRCGFTPQYAGLEALYRRYCDQGLVVLGFPCDQFGHQEPGTNDEIRRFCSDTYDVTFPMFAKVQVNGANTHPLFVFLKARRPGPLGVGRILWNFTKFLVARDGQVLARRGPRTAPAEIEPDIDRALHL